MDSCTFMVLRNSNLRARATTLCGRAKATGAQSFSVQLKCLRMISKAFPTAPGGWGVLPREILKKCVLSCDFWHDVRRPVVYFLFRKHYISTVSQCDLPPPPPPSRINEHNLVKTSGAPIFINNGNGRQSTQRDN